MAEKEEKVEVKEELKEEVKAEKTEEKPKKKKKVKVKNLIIILVILVVLGVVGFFVATKVILPGHFYSKGKEALESENYEKAVKNLKNLDDYKDSDKLLKEAYFGYAKTLTEEGKFDDARKMLKKSKNDEVEQYTKYLTALENISKKEYDKGISALVALDDYEKAKEHLTEAYYARGEDSLKNNKFDVAKTSFEKAGDLCPVFITTLKR